MKRLFFGTAKTTTSGESSTTTETGAKPQVEQPQHSQPQGKPEEGEGEHRK